MRMSRGLMFRFFMCGLDMCCFWVHGQSGWLVSRNRIFRFLLLVLLLIEFLLWFPFVCRVLRLGFGILGRIGWRVIIL